MPSDAHIQLKREDLETKSIATRVISAHRKTSWLTGSVVVAAVVLSAVTTSAIIFTRPTHVDKGALVDSTNAPVGTAKIGSINDLKQAPALGSEYDYNSMESVKLQIVDPETNQPGMLNLRVVGSFWYNATDMDFFLETGLTLHSSKVMGSSVMKLAPTIRNAFGVTPAEHRRKLVLCFGICIGLVILAATSVSVAAYMVATRSEM